MLITLHGTRVAWCGDLEYKSSWNHPPIPYLARMLIEGGHDGEEVVTVMRGTTECFNKLPLQWWAERVFRESFSGSVKEYEYAPYNPY